MNENCRKENEENIGNVSGCTEEKEGSVNKMNGKEVHTDPQPTEKSENIQIL